MSIETYQFHYSSDQGWEGNFEKAGIERPPRPDEVGKSSGKVSLTLAITALLVIIIGVLYSLNIIPHRQYSDADFNIETYHSQNDQDHDGIDDQADILTSTREYLARKPHYESKYYATGYPDDNHGVCTDVVAFALQGAGYNLMALVNDDIKNHPEAYDIETPDPNIDFRRVKNLQTYFQRHAINLTTDRNLISEWQAGDIVVFEDHIGIVSDHRNKHGVPFLLHHYSPAQVTYEEDALGRYKIIGHYRIS